MQIVVPRALQGLYFFCEAIADGAFGRLYLAIHSLTHQYVAIKVIEKKKLGEETNRIDAEINALKNLRHPNIYSLYQVVETSNTFYLVLEYVPGGELFDYILHNGSLEEPHARLLFRQLISAIGYSHSQGIAHRDLKPENILLKDAKNIRVIDFGLCAKNADKSALNTYCGSLAYAAPEILQNKEYSGPAADIWSMGVILYTMLCGCLPFDPSRPEKLPKLIVKGQFSLDEGLSEKSRDLIARMLCVDPAQRIGMADVCAHPWVVEGHGGPVALPAASVAPHPEPPIVASIIKQLSRFTHIPPAEMVRMIRRRSYDYLSAAYAIMEHLLEEEQILLILRPRYNPPKAGEGGGGDKPSPPPPPVTAPLSEKPPHREKTPEARPLRLKTRSQGVLTERNMTNLSPSQLMPPPMAPHATPCRKESPKVITLSPGRSIDSQLQQISKDLKFTDRSSFVSRAPSDSCLERDDVPTDVVSSDGTDEATTREEGEDEEDRGAFEDVTMGPPSSSTPSPNYRHHNHHYHQQQQPTTAAAEAAAPRLLPLSDLNCNTTAVYSSVLESTGTIGDLHGAFRLGDVSLSSVTSGSSGGATVPGTSGGNLLRNLLRVGGGGGGCSSKSSSASASASAVAVAATPSTPAPLSAKLRKIKVGGGGGGSLLSAKGGANNNVMLTRPELTAAEVLERISDSLTRNSIRFSLKRHGFTCTFSNDWGRVLLEFSIEVVAVVGGGGAKSSLSKRLHNHLAAVKTSSSSKNTSQQSLDFATAAAATPTPGSSAVGQSQNQELGVKIKRLHGDAFTYASICRTVLDQADIKRPATAS